MSVSAIFLASKWVFCLQASTSCSAGSRIAVPSQLGDRSGPEEAVRLSTFRGNHGRRDAGRNDSRRLDGYCEAMTRHVSIASRLLAAILLPLLVIAWTPSAGQLFRCLMDG